MSKPLSSIHHRMLPLPTHLRMAFTVLPHNCTTPPSVNMPLYHSPSATAFFWSVWNRELPIRRATFLNIKHKDAWDTIKGSVIRSLPALPYAPMPWIRDLLPEVHPQAICGLFEPGQWLYASVSPMLRAPYFGQTGAITNPRAVFTRWKEELQQGLAWVEIQKSRRGPTYFQYLHQLGFHNFLPLPVKPLPCFEADRQEQRFIATHQPNLNDKKHKQKGFLRWLIRHRMVRHLTDSALQDQQPWDRQLQLRRLSITPYDAIMILNKAKGTLNGWKYGCLQKRFIPFVQRSLHITLPYFLPLHIPCITPKHTRTVRRAFQQFLHCTSLPKPIKLYIQSILLLPQKLTPKLVRLFTRDRIQISLQQAESDVSTSTMPNSILTGPQLYQTTHHPELKSLLHASLGTCVAPPKHLLHRQLSTQLNAIRQAIPHIKPFPFKHFASAVHTVVNICLHPKNVLLLPHKLVQKFFTLVPDSVPIRVDKYPLLFVVATTVTFLRIFIHAFKGAKNYRHILTTSSAVRSRHVLLVYYYLCARLFPFVVRNVSQMRQRNALSVQIPQLKGIALPRLHVSPPATTLPTDFLSVKCKLLSAASDIMTLTDNILYIPPNPAYDQKMPRSQYPPSVILSLKGKSLPYKPPAPISSVTTREIFSNGGQPWKNSYSIIRRVASVAQRFCASIFFTLLVCDQQQMEEHFLPPAKEYFHTLGESVAGFELDLERMFPSLIRKQPRPSYVNPFARARAMYCTARAENHLFISIAKGNTKQLDCVGKKSPKYFHILSDDDLVAAVTAESCLNDFFQLGPEIWEQFTGVTIGGKLASQNANIMLMEKESNVNFDKELPPHTKLCRYVDNIVCLCPATQLLSTIRIVHRLLHRTYGVPLTVEQLGTSFTSLQFQILCVDSDIHWGLKNKCLLSHLTNRIPLSRYPAVNSMYAKRVIQGMLHNLLGLSSSLQTHPSIFLSNLSHTIWEMQRNHYPTSWWLPKVRTTYRCFSQSSLPPLERVLCYFALDSCHSS